MINDVTPSATTADVNPELDAATPAPSVDQHGATATVTVTVAPGQTGTLPTTGPNAGVVAAIGLVLVLLALLAFAWARKTRRT